MLTVAELKVPSTSTELHIRFQTMGMHSLLASRQPCASDFSPADLWRAQSGCHTPVGSWWVAEVALETR